MGEIFVKKNNAFERVVGEGITIITGGGGGGGGGVTIAFHARQNESTNSSHYIPYSSSANFPLDGTLESPSNPGFLINFRNLSKYFDVIDVNTNSLNTGQPFNSETGVFTAPVAGVYRFTASGTVGLYQEGDNVSANNSSSFRMWLRKNPANANQIANFANDRVGSVLFVARDDEKETAFASMDIHHPSHTWELELQANDRIVLCAAWFKGDQTENTTDPFPQNYRVWVGDCSFSGSYVGGRSVTPRDPVAMYATVGRALLGTENPNSPSGSINLLPKIYKFDGLSTRVCNQIFLPASSPYNTFVESTDKSNAFNPQTGVFVAPVKGVYSIGFDISLIDEDPDLGHWYAFWIQKTSASVSIPEAASSFRGDPLNAYANDVRRETKFGNATYSDQNYHWLVEMEAGEKITWHMLGTNTVNNVTAIRLSANLLTSTQTIDPPLETPVTVYAHSTPRDGLDVRGFGNNILYGQGIFRVRNGITVPAPVGAPNPAIRTFTLNELVDSSGSFNVNTGVFTAPIGGLYSITMYAELQDGQTTYSADPGPSSIEAYATMWIRKTPAGQSALVAPTDPQDPLRYGQLVRVSSGIVDETMHMSGDWLVQMNEGDQITWYANPNGLVSTTAGNKLQSIALSANLITPTDRNIKMSRGSAPAMYATIGDWAGYSTNSYTYQAPSLPTNPFVAKNSTLSGTGSYSFNKHIDTASAFNPTTGIFVAPIKGVYKVGYDSIWRDMNLANVPNESIKFWIQKTSFGSQVPAEGNDSNAYANDVRIEVPYGTAYYSNFGYDWLVEMEAGDQITWHIQARSSDGANPLRMHSFSVSAHLLTSTETVFSDGNPDVLFAFHTKNTEETTGGAGTVLFRTASTSGTNYLLRTNGTGEMQFFGVGVEVTDLTSSFDPATGKFTAPVSGWYELDGQVDWYTGGTGLGRMFLWMEKNNTTSTSTPLVNAGTAGNANAPNHLINRRVEALSGSTAWTVSQNIKNIVYLSQGETVAMCINAIIAPARPAVTHWSFSGKRIPPVNSSSGIGAGTVYSDYSATMPGWTKIAPGVIMQWGIETINTTDTATWGNDNTDPRKTITFPKPFTAIPSLTVTYQQTSAFAGAGQSYVAQSAGVGGLTAQIGAQSVQTSPGDPNGAKLHWQAVGLG